MTDAEIINEILEREGGYVDHPADRGGPTNHGITLATLSGYRRATVTAADMKALTIDEARTIYREQFIVAPGFYTITNDKLRALVVDCGVNHGPKRALVLLQRALGVPPDGDFGPVTQAAVAIAGDQTFARLCAERARLYGKIITGNHSQAVFAAGWLNRLAGFVEQA